MTEAVLGTAGGHRDDTRSPDAVVVAESVLAPKQVLALRTLVEGGSPSEAAATAGVDRTTLYRWRTHDANFIAALNAWRHERQCHARDRLMALSDAAVDTVRKRIEDGDGHLAMRVLKGIGCAEAGPVEPRSPKALVAQSGKRFVVYPGSSEDWFNQAFRRLDALPAWVKGHVIRIIDLGHRAINPTLRRTPPPDPDEFDTEEEYAIAARAYSRAVKAARRKHAAEVEALPDAPAETGGEYRIPDADRSEYATDQRGILVPEDHHAPGPEDADE